MADGGMGFKGFSVARLGRMAQRPITLAEALNQSVVATEWVARLILLLAALLMLYYAADREPPFEMHTSEPSEAHAGDYVTIRAKVTRDVSRRCNTEFSRYVFDSHGTRFDLGRSQASADAIASMERRSPGVLAVAFVVPHAAKPGPAIMQTVLQYKCNRVHHFWPIETTAEMPFVVLP
jgi:hypothetical protein